MITPQLSRLIRPYVLVERAIWAIITGSILFYFVLAYVLAGGNQSAYDQTLSGTGAVFYIAAAAVTAVSVFYRRRTFSERQLRAVLKKGVDIDALSGVVGADGTHSERLAILKTLSESELRAFTLMSDVQKASIINLILNEFVIMLGFVMAFLSGDFVKIIPFGIASLLLNIWMFPRPESVIEKSQKLSPE